MKTAKNRNLRGSVLFTVVFVMSILIVFLFGTLALALAANNRAHVNYSSAQTKITARTVAESAVKALSDSTDGGKAYANAVAALGADDAPLSVDVSLAASGAPGASDPRLGSMGRISPVTISYAGKRKYYDATKGWTERDLLKFTATVTQNGVESTTSVYAMKFFEEDDQSGSSGGAGFVSVADTAFACQASLYGGSYVNLPMWDDGITDELKFYEDLSKKKRTTASNNGDTFIFPNDDNNNTHYFRQQNSGSVYEADVMIYNNLDSGNLSEIYFPDAGLGISVFGNWSFGNGDNLRLVAGPDLDKYYKKAGDPASKTIESIPFNKIPYIFINGKMFGSNHIEFGSNSPSFPLNVFCGWVEAGNVNSIDVAGDFFCMNDTDELGNRVVNRIKNFNTTGDSSLYGWVGSVINKTEPVNTKTRKNTSNSVYIKGDVVFTGNNHIYGDLRVQGNVTIESGANLTVERDFVCGGTFTKTGNFNQGAGGKMYTSTGTGGGIREIENLKGTWYQFAINEDDPVDIYGDPIELSETSVKLSDGTEFNRSDFTDDKLHLFYAVRPNVDRTIIEEVRANIFEGPYTWGDSRRRHIPGNDWEFYVPTNLNGSVDPATASDDEVLAAREAEVDMITDESTFKVPLGNGLNIEQFKALHNGQEIYPEYAERGVILGLKTIGTLPKDQTQIVKTIRDITRDVTNPYEYTRLKNDKIREMYDNAVGKRVTDIGTAASTYTRIGSYNFSNTIDADSVTEANPDGNTISGVTDFNTFAAKVRAGTPVRFQKSDGVTPINNSAPGGGEAIYIGESCTLNLSGAWSSEMYNPVIIDPGSGEICVIIENLQLGDPYPIIIDDTSGGVAYIYIEDNGTLKFAGGKMGAIETVKYMNYFYDDSISSVKINSTIDGADDILAKLGAPNAYIYGGKDSTLDLGNFQWAAVNILSPYLSVRIASTDRGGADYLNSWRHFYYNDEDLLNTSFGKLNPGALDSSKASRQYLFGCLNANTVDLPNIINVIHTPSDKNKSGNTDRGDTNYDYWILYYTDF